MTSDWTFEVERGPVDGKPIAISVHVVMPEVGRLQVTLSGEGIIIDAYDTAGQEVLGTVGRMYDEWHEALVESE